MSAIPSGYGRHLVDISGVTCDMHYSAGVDICAS